MSIFISKNEHPQLWTALRVLSVLLTALLDAVAYMIWGNYPKKKNHWHKDKNGQWYRDEEA